MLEITYTVIPARMLKTDTQSGNYLLLLQVTSVDTLDCWLEEALWRSSKSLISSYIMRFSGLLEKPN